MYQEVRKNSTVFEIDNEEAVALVGGDLAGNEDSQRQRINTSNTTFRANLRLLSVIGCIALVIGVAFLKNEVWVQNKMSNDSITAFYPPQRTYSLGENNDTMFSFVHISKCAGAAWISQLKPLLSPNFFPGRTSGIERSVAYQRTETPNAHFLTSIRSPRHHVWSQYAECRYDPFFIKQKGYPHAWKDMKDDEAFDWWISNFVNETTSAAGDSSINPPYYVVNKQKGSCFDCYHPSNYMSRPFTSNEKQPHNVDKISGFEPNISAVIDTLNTMAWFSIQEFFHESKCLLFYRLSSDDGGNTLPKGGQLIHQYLNETCHCNNEAAQYSNSSSTDNNNNNNNNNPYDQKVTHHSGGKRSTMLDLPADVLQKIEALTRIDVLLYKEGLQQFLPEIVWLEQSLGRRVLCDSVLQKVEPEIAYLGWNVTEMYYRIRGTVQS